LPIRGSGNEDEGVGERSLSHSTLPGDADAPNDFYIISHKSSGHDSALRS
jgi:hypothetical protein